MSKETKRKALSPVDKVLMLKEGNYRKEELIHKVLLLKGFGRKVSFQK